MNRLKATALLLAVAATPARAEDAPLIASYAKAVVTAPPKSLKLDPFYAKATDALGIVVVSSSKVPDDALLVARDVIIHMLAKRPDVRERMVSKAMRVVVMARSESTTDLPEQRDWKKPRPDDPRLTVDEKAHYQERIGRLTDKEYWDKRARGMGGNPTSCAEENLLGYPGTRYFGENILVHEFSHAIMNIGLRDADPALYREIHAAYKSAMAKGLWKVHYGATTANEYWAEGTQTWFESNYAFHNGDKRIATADDLKEYDPTLFALLARVYHDHHIPLDVYHARDIPPPTRAR